VKFIVYQYNDNIFIADTSSYKEYMYTHGEWSHSYDYSGDAHFSQWLYHIRIIKPSHFSLEVEANSLEEAINMVPTELYL